MEPLLLQPAYKDYLWGGRKLKTKYNKDFPPEIIAETWECSTHPDGLSIIKNGTYAGKTLNELVKEYPKIIGNNKTFPILTKFIDSNQDLSIQVHPDDEYALKHENDNGKAEMWYVVEADPNAYVFIGFKNNMTEKSLKESVEKGTLPNHLNKIKVHKGDRFFIKPGTIHAIGAGCTIVEIQENSNITYRVYDYKRKDKNGDLRELHINKALDVLEMNKQTILPYKSTEIRTKNYLIERIIKDPLFDLNRIKISKKWETIVDRESFKVITVINGKGSINSTLKIRKGDTVFLPAGSGLCQIDGKIEILEVKA